MLPHYQNVITQPPCPLIVYNNSTSVQIYTINTLRLGVLKFLQRGSQHSVCVSLCLSYLHSLTTPLRSQSWSPDGDDAVCLSVPVFHLESHWDSRIMMISRSSHHYCWMNYSSVGIFEAFLMHWLKYDFGNRKTGSAIFAASDLDLYHQNDIILMVTLITWLRQYRSRLATVTLLFLPLLYTIFFGRKALDNSQLEVIASFSLLPPGCSIYINYLEFP